MAEATIEIRPILVDEYLEVVGPDVIRVKGHRIGLEHIVEYYQEGFSPEQIALEFPGLALSKIYAVIAYYLYHQREVDAYLARVNLRTEAAYQQWATTPSIATQRVQALRVLLLQEQKQ